MRASLFSATIVATLIATGSLNPIFAQAPAGGAPRPAAGGAAAPAPSGTNVAVIDIGFIFKNHKNFNTQMERLNKEMEEFQAWVKAEEKSFLAMREELAQFKSGTPQYQAKEEEMAKKQTETQLEIRRRQKDFLEREAKQYYETYAQLESEIATFSQRNRIGLVLRFNREQMKSDDRASVLQGINRAVVYHYGLDITKFVLDKVSPGWEKSPVADTRGKNGPGTSQK